MEFLDNSIRCNIGIDNVQYNIGDIIHYPGSYYGHKNFYAYIDKKTPMSLSIIVLIKENKDNDEVIFYSTSTKYKGLTRRPFNLFNQ